MACHQGSTLDGETDVYIEDDIYRAAVLAEEDAAAAAAAADDDEDEDEDGSGSEADKDAPA